MLGLIKEITVDYALSLHTQASFDSEPKRCTVEFAAQVYCQASMGISELTLSDGFRISKYVNAKAKI
jgi:hypothetical protein